MSGHVLDGAGTVSAPVMGLLSAGGFHGRIMLVPRGVVDVSIGVAGATFIFDSLGPTVLNIPAVSPGVSLRFIAGRTPASSSFTVQLPARDAGKLYGSVTVGNAVPPATTASGASRIVFGASAAPGDRVSLISDGARWYVADGICSDDGGITFE